MTAASNLINDNFHFWVNYPLYMCPCTDQTIHFLCVFSGTESPKGESSSLDEDSSDALSPDPQCSQDSPVGLAPQHSPSDMMKLNGDLSPTQVYCCFSCSI